MSPILQIDGIWYAMGDLAVAKDIQGSKYLGSNGHAFTCRGALEFHGRRHPLTPINPPLEWKLGCEVLGAVPEEYRDKVVRYGKPEKGESSVNEHGQHFWGGLL